MKTLISILLLPIIILIWLSSGVVFAAVAAIAFKLMITCSIVLVIYIINKK